MACFIYDNGFSHCHDFVYLTRYKPWWNNAGPYLSSVTTLGSELVDLRFSNISTFLSLLQLMLHLPELGQVSVGLLLL